MESERRVNPACPNAGNPFHQCAGYCAGGGAGGRVAVTGGKKPGFFSLFSKFSPFLADFLEFFCSVVILILIPLVEVANGEGARVEGRFVDPNCVNATNPFHQCAEYCTKKAAYAKKQTGSGLINFPLFFI